MAIDAQGTSVYFRDPTTGTVHEVACVTALSGIDATRAENDITCLRDLARRRRGGLLEPGTASLTVNFDPEDPSTVLLHQLYAQNETLDWAVGLSDGEAPPTIDPEDETEFVLPADRSWIVFEGFISAFPWDFTVGGVVTNSLSVSVSGIPSFVPRVPTP